MNEITSFIESANSNNMSLPVWLQNASTVGGAIGGNLGTCCCLLTSCCCCWWYSTWQRLMKKIMADLATEEDKKHFREMVANNPAVLTQAEVTLALNRIGGSPTEGNRLRAEINSVQHRTPRATGRMRKAQSQQSIAGSEATWRLAETTPPPAQSMTTGLARSRPAARDESIRPAAAHRTRASSSRRKLSPRAWSSGRSGTEASQNPFFPVQELEKEGASSDGSPTSSSNKKSAGPSSGDKADHRIPALSTLSRANPPRRQPGARAQAESEALSRAEEGLGSERKGRMQRRINEFYRPIGGGHDPRQGERQTKEKAKADTQKSRVRLGREEREKRAATHSAETGTRSPRKSAEHRQSVRQQEVHREVIPLPPPATSSSHEYGRQPAPQPPSSREPEFQLEPRPPSPEIQPAPQQPALRPSSSRQPVVQKPAPWPPIPAWATKRSDDDSRTTSSGYGSATSTPHGRVSGPGRGSTSGTSTATGISGSRKSPPRAGRSGHVPGVDPEKGEDSPPLEVPFRQGSDDNV